MPAQLTASAHVDIIGCVFLQLIMGFKYRSGFFGGVYVFSRSLCGPCKTTQSSIFCTGETGKRGRKRVVLFSNTQDRQTSRLYL